MKIITSQNHNESSQGQSIFHQRPVLLLMILTCLFVAGFLVRARYLDESRMISERQYRSALIARAFYFENSTSVPQWRKDIAAISNQRIGILEPPVMEAIVSYIYRIIGYEHLNVARYTSILFWLMGGFFLIQITRRIGSIETAIIATIYYLFIPMGVILSISFLPDPLMILMFLVSLYLILVYFENPKISNLVAAGVASGFAILVKPFILFGLISTFFFLEIYKKGSFRKSIDRNLLIFIIISLVPTSIYYGFHMATGGFLRGQAQGSILPQLLFTFDYWWSWMKTASRAVVPTLLIAALLGISLLRDGLSRYLLAGLWIGYIIFCLVFTNHIRFADYYHSQLIIIVAISICPLIGLFIQKLKQYSFNWYWFLPILGALILIALNGYQEIKGRLANFPDFESEASAREIGDLVQHSSRVVYVAPFYGMPLQYYGELSGTYWPRSVSDRDRALGQHNTKSVEERIEALEFFPEYFVITDIDQFEAYHSDLNEYLSQDCSLVAMTETYHIYNDCPREF